jgi:uncharacterized protein YegP (UPF0339 family)
VKSICICGYIYNPCVDVAIALVWRVLILIVQSIVIIKIKYIYIIFQFFRSNKIAGFFRVIFFSLKARNMDIITAEKYTTEAEAKFATERR